LEAHTRARFDFAFERDHGLADYESVGEIYDGSLVYDAGGMIEIPMTGNDIGNLGESAVVAVVMGNVI
jgi:hypothetical protein